MSKHCEGISTTTYVTHSHDHEAGGANDKYAGSGHVYTGASYRSAITAVIRQAMMAVTSRRESITAVSNSIS